jgi:hypothetical protein
VSIETRNQAAQTKNLRFGEATAVLDADGRVLRAAVLNEHVVRAAAGLTMALGAFAFVEAWFAKAYGPIRIVTAVFFIDFLIRVTIGIRHSPTGTVARWITRRQPPQWVSARPKRFAWTLGMVLALAMTVITNSGIHGSLPLTICLLCLSLMWLESALGLCLGCEIHGLMVRRGWLHKDEAFEICSHGACSVELHR